MQSTANMLHKVVLQQDHCGQHRLALCGSCVPLASCDMTVHSWIGASSISRASLAASSCCIGFSP